MTGTRMFLVLAAAGFVLIVSRPAHAAKAEDPVKLSVTIGGEYTDNRDSLPDGEDNIDIFVSPQINLVHSSGRGAVDFSYTPTYRYRSEPSDLQNESELHHDLGLNGNYMLLPERLKVRGSEQFNLTDDPAIVEGGTTLRRDSSFTMNRAEVGAAMMFGSRTQLDARGRHMIKMYEESIVADESDESSMGARLLLWREMMVGKLGVMLTGEYETFDYESARGLERGFDATSGGLGLEMRPGAMLRATVYGGIKQLEYNDSELGSESSPYVSLLVRLSPHDMTEIRLNGSYGLRDADVYPFASQDYTSAGLGLTWRPVVSWVVDLGAEYRHGKYETAYAPVEATDPTYVRPVGGNDDTIVAQGSLKYIFANETTSITLTQSYEDSDSDVSYSFTRNATRLGFTKQF